MSNVKESLEMIHQLGNISGLTRDERKMVHGKEETLPGLYENIQRFWKGRREGIREEKEYRELYDILAESHAGSVAAFEELYRSISDPSKEILPDKDEVYAWGEELSAFSPRVPGTQSMEQTAEYIKEKINQCTDMELLEEKLPFRGVFFHKWSFEITLPFSKSYTCFPQNNVAFGDVESEVVYVGKGREEDYAGKDVVGKILLMDWGTLWEHEGPCALRQRYGLLALYDRAYERGAVGIIGFFQDTPGNTLKLLEPGIKPVGGSNISGAVESGEEHGFALPVLTIGRKDALALLDEINKSRVNGRLVIEGVRKVSKAPILIGYLPGKSDEIIACGSHTCTAFEGAICDTVGVVAEIALMKYFSQIPQERREKSMLFFFDSFHVWGNCCQVALTVLDRHQSLANKIHSMIWLDHLSDGKDSMRSIVVSDNPVLWPLTTFALARQGIEPSALPIARIWSLCATGAHERQGISTITVQAMNDDLLTPEDTWDKFDKKILYRDVVAHVILAEALHRIEIPLNVPGEPIGGCGSLFTEIDTPEFPEGEEYVPEKSYPLYLGGASSPIQILQR